MADMRKKFSCSKCHGVVNVPIKYLGKRIKCPQSAFVFRAGQKQPEEVEIVAELDEEAAPTFAAPIPASYAPPMQPLASSQPLPPSRPATPYRSKMANRPTKQQREMTESDSNWQSTGIFLLILPVIATVLPLAGLQLRNLARLGELAPLAALVAGLVGVGMICYARRNQGDAPLLGSVAALFVLVTGIGGFFTLSALAPSENDSGYSDQHSNAANNWPSTNASEARARSAAARERLTGDVESSWDTHKQMREEADRMMQKAQESHRKAVEEMRKGFGNPPSMPGAGFPSGASGPPNIPPPNFGRGFGGRRN